MPCASRLGSCAAPGGDLVLSGPTNIDQLTTVFLPLPTGFMRITITKAPKRAPEKLRPATEAADRRRRDEKSPTREPCERDINLPIRCCNLMVGYFGVNGFGL